MVNNKIYKDILVFIIAPLIPAILLALWFGLFDPELSFLSYLTGMESILIIVSGYMASTLFGIPLHIFLKKREEKRFLTYLICGSLIGLVLGITRFNNLFFSQRIFNGAFGMVYAAIAASTFWYIAVRDESSKNEPPADCDGNG